MKGVGWASKAINAAMFATAISVDGTVERDIGRLVAGDDCFGAFDGDRGFWSYGCFVERFAHVEPVAVICARRQVEAGA